MENAPSPSQVLIQMLRSNAGFYGGLAKKGANKVGDFVERAMKIEGGMKDDQARRAMESTGVNPEAYQASFNRPEDKELFTPAYAKVLGPLFEKLVHIRSNK